MKIFFKALGITLLIALCVITFYATLFLIDTHFGSIYTACVGLFFAIAIGTFMLYKAFKD